MNKLAFVIATDEELNKSFLKSFKKSRINSLDVYFKKIKNKEFYLVITGIGKVNMAHTISKILNNLKIKNIINIGSVAANNQSLKINDVVFCKKARYIDVDLTPFNYKPGQCAKEKPYFNSSLTFSDKLFNLLNKKFKKQCIKNIFLGTSDSFVESKNIKNFSITKDIDVIDMEGTALLQVVNKYPNVNTAIIKIISDHLKAKAKNSQQWDKNIVKIRNIICQIIDLIINNV